MTAIASAGNADLPRALSLTSPTQGGRLHVVVTDVTRLVAGQHRVDLVGRWFDTTVPADPGTRVTITTHLVPASRLNFTSMSSAQVLSPEGAIVGTISVTPTAADRAPISYVKAGTNQVLLTGETLGAWSFVDEPDKPGAARFIASIGGYLLGVIETITSACDPSFKACVSAARDACSPLRAQVSYSCDPMTGVVSCSWTCRPLHE
ncbi:hypothetical protein J4558_06940 [Leptolyngbya sp. 15MV]|nr:hypothetical protein J4558_06940 [Leptolyngbya sp. 15MV]